MTPLGDPYRPTLLTHHHPPPIFAPNQPPNIPAVGNRLDTVEVLNH